MAGKFNFERCPMCMEVMDPDHGGCPACSFFRDFVTEHTYENGDILHLPPELNLPFYAGARVRHIDFGSVFLGYSTHLKRKVFLKEFFPFPLLVRDHNQAGRCFTPHDAHFEDVADQVIAEAQALSKLVIPGAEQVYGAFRANGTVYQVTEYICGPSMAEITLTELWKVCSLLFPRNAMERKIPELSFYRLIRPLLALLQRMHYNGIYHGNLEPSCILLDMQHPRLVLANLGTALAHSRHSSTSSALELFNEYLPGTYSMLTPEQTDVYSICCVIYYILVGSLPPWNPYTASREIKDSPLPRVIENVLVKGSSPQRIKNYSGMAELIAALDDAFTKLAKHCK